MSLRVTVVGFGAMGSGMAKRLHMTGHCVNVYDVDPRRISEFAAFQAANPMPAAAGEHAQPGDGSLLGATRLSDVIIVCVLDEPQCESVLDTLVPGVARVAPDAGGVASDGPSGGHVVSVLITSTVAPEYVAALPHRVEAAQALNPCTSGRTFRIVDSPISGGAIRSELGSLIVMVGAPPADVDRVRPVLQGMTDYVAPGEAKGAGGYYVCGPRCGDGMMVKICHQLVAGSNLACAAEGFALAKACGVYSDTFVEICNRGAASSFMLQNRGARIGQALNGLDPPCMSSVAVWKKDLGIVRALASSRGLRGRMFEAALQGYLACGERFGFEKDDSCFTKMLADDAAPSAAAGAALAVEVGDEPRHRVMLENEYVRAISVRIPDGDETLIHTHSVDSLYFFIVPPAPTNPLGPNTMKVVNTIYDTDNNTVTSEDSFMTYGECRFGNHCSKKLIHKIKCMCSGNGKGAHCVDIELKKRSPTISGATDLKEIVSDGINVQLVKDKEKANVFQLTIKPAMTWTFDSYMFFYMVLVMQGGESTISRGPISWSEHQKDGECTWHSPGEAPWSIRNDTSAEMIFFIIQWK